MIERRARPYLLYLLLAVSLAAVTYSRVRLLSVPLERDEGEFAYLGQLILKGVSPFAQAYTMKIPGVGLMYALFMLLLGETATAVHTGLLLTNLACIGLVFLLAQRLFEREGALAAATSFAILSLSQSVYGVFAHATHFVILFSLAGLLCLLRHTDKGGGKQFVFLGGLCLGFAFIMKQHAILFFLFAAAWLIRTDIRSPGRDTKGLAVNILRLVSGLFIPYLLIVAWLAKAGTFSQFWFWTVTYARDYASALPVSEGLTNLYFQTVAIMTPQFPLWLIAISGGILLAQKSCRANRLFLSGFLLFSFLSICPGLYFREHYYIMLLPAVALFIGAALQSASSLPGLASSSGKRSIPAILFLLAVAYGLFSERDFFFYQTPRQASRSTYGTNPFPEAVEVARYLKERSAPGDRIAVIGSEPEIYFYANRLSATGYIYMYGLVEKHANAENMQRQLIREIEAAKPAFVVVIKVQSSWLGSSTANGAVFSWCRRYVEAGYDMVGIADIVDFDQTRYEWGNAAKNYSPVSDSFIVVFKRKT